MLPRTMGRSKRTFFKGIGGNIMDIKIVTPEDMEVIEEFIKEQDFYKVDTSDTIRETFMALIGYGMKAQIALNNIEAVVGAIKSEYGE